MAGNRGVQKGVPRVKALNSAAGSGGLHGYGVWQRIPSMQFSAVGRGRRGLPLPPIFQPLRAVEKCRGVSAPDRASTKPGYFVEAL